MSHNCPKNNSMLLKLIAFGMCNTDPHLFVSNQRMTDINQYAFFFRLTSSLLDTIQDNYTFAQPGIQKKVADLKDLMSRADRKLHTQNF